MIHNPKIGMNCWAFVNVDGDAAPVPVTVADISQGEIAVTWEVAEFCTERHEGLTDKDLYATEKEAFDYMFDERSKADAGKRNRLFSGQNFG